MYSTAALCDAHAHEPHFQIAEPLLYAFGATTTFGGKITTLKVFEEHLLIQQALEESGQGRVLVIDGGGSHRCALIDADLVKLAIANDWQGIVLYGCIRDAEHINTLPIGIRALHTHPLKSHAKDHGDRDLVVSFAGINFKKDHFLVADADGIVVSATLFS